MPKTKIICTLGPASDTISRLTKMSQAGMDVIRLNFSHGTLQQHLARIQRIRKINRQTRRKIKILGDLEGHRIRIGKLSRGQAIMLKKGQRIWLTAEKIAGKKSIIPFDYTGPLAPLKDRYIYIDDGNIRLFAEKVRGNSVRARVSIGGLLKEHKGVNIPDVKLDFQGLTEKDKRCVDFSLQNKVDFIAQSFVRNRQDVLDLKTYLSGRGRKIRIVAKIENREGIKNINEIIKACDGIMVARGDMGVSIPIYEVPLVQKEIIRKCNRAGKTVITATQMLESMTENHIPTRAEVSDVANAILDGTNYVMLSGETAIGVYPVETVDMMNKIIQYTERNTKA